MHLYDYSEITLNIPSNIVDSMMEIERIRAFDAYRMRRYTDELAIGRAANIMREAGTNMDPSGETLDEDMLYSLYTRRRGDDDLGMETVGYMKALREAFETDRPPFDESAVLQMHRSVTNGVTRRESRFRYRQSQDIAADPDAHSVVPVPSVDVESSMHQMIDSYNVAFGVGVQPILLVPCMALDFLNIHPFTEANWRVSRVMMRGLLIAAGYPALKYVPFDRFLMDDPEEYYESVSDSSEGWRKNANDPYPFIEHVVEAVLKSYREFGLRYPIDDGRKLKKSERVLNLLSSEPDREFRKRDIITRLPDVKLRSLDAVLPELIETGSIQKIGGFKNACYRKS